MSRPQQQVAKLVRHDVPEDLRQLLDARVNHCGDTGPRRTDPTAVTHDDRFIISTVTPVLLNWEQLLKR